MERQYDFVKNLDPVYQESLSWYTGGNFDKLNDNLRKGNPLTKEQEVHLERIDAIFDHIPPLKKPMVVYRGKSGDKIYSDNTFISTSLNYEKAKAWAGKNCCVLQIIVSQGSKVIPLETLSRYADENEVLLDRNQQLYITGEMTKGDMKTLFCFYKPS